MIANMKKVTKSYLEDLSEYTKASSARKHTLLHGVSECFVEMQINLNKFQDYYLAQQKTYQAIVLEERLKDEEENTPNKPSHETVVQDVEEYILTEVKKEQYCNQSLENHLKKEEVQGGQPTVGEWE